MPVAERLDVFTPFLKKERDADGVLWVEGKFTGPDLDSDGQRMDPTWLKSAIPAYMKVGNVREGHDPHRAIGKAVQVWETDDHSWHMKAKIVDPVAEKKIEHGILSGFSIGVANYGLVKAVDAPNGCVNRGDVIEVSAVDRPSLPSAMFRMAELSKATGMLALVDEPALVEGDDIDKTAAPDDPAPAPQMMLKTSDGQVRPMTAALVDELTAPTVVANPDDPDAADPEALEKAKKGGKGVGNKKAPPFVADGKAKDDDSEDDTDETDDDKPGGKKPASKSADVDIEALVKSLVAAELAKHDQPPTAAEPESEPTEPAEKTAEPDIVKDAGLDLTSLDAADHEIDDIAVAKAVITGLAWLIKSEACGLLAGQLGESFDVSLLTQAVEIVKCFLDREAAEVAEYTPPAGGDTNTGGSSPMADTVPSVAGSVMSLAAEPDLLKDAATKAAKKLRKRLDKAAAAVAATAAPTETTGDDASTEAVEKAAGTTDIEALTKAVTTSVLVEVAGQFGDAITKAMGPLAEGLAEVKATLHSTPRPGGPVVTRVAPVVPSEQLAKAAQIKARRDTYEGMLRGASTAGERAAINALIAELDKPAA